jgi:hypothetical protein
MKAAYGESDAYILTSLAQPMVIIEVDGSGGVMVWRSSVACMRLADSELSGYEQYFKLMRTQILEKWHGKRIRGLSFTMHDDSNPNRA